MAKRVRNHTNPFTVRENFERLDYKQLQPNFSGTVDLEVGFGRGIFFQHWATKYPEHLLLGIEVRMQIVTLLKESLNERKIKNAHAYRGEASIFLEQAIPDNSLDRVFIFHPDPWPKKRHAKRRVLKIDFLKLMNQKLKNDGQLFISTDVESLWENMTESINEEGSFVKSENQDFWTSDYLSHWDSFSIEDDRKRFFCTFKKRV